MLKFDAAVRLDLQHCSQTSRIFPPCLQTRPWMLGKVFPTALLTSLLLAPLRHSELNASEKIQVAMECPHSRLQWFEIAPFRLFALAEYAVDNRPETYITSKKSTVSAMLGQVTAVHCPGAQATAHRCHETSLTHR